MDAPDRQCTQSHGFSLIEVIIAMLLIGILGVVGSNLISASVFSNQVISNEHQAYARARYALERMSREIREMQYNDASTSMSITNPVSTNMTAVNLSFTKDGLLSTSLMTITYTPSSGDQLGSIALNDGTGPHELARNLVNSAANSQGIFKYYKANGEEATSGSDVSYIRIDVDVKPDSTKEARLKLSNLIYLRNR